MRKKLMAANWKMYKNPEQTKAFFHEFLPLVDYSFQRSELRRIVRRQQTRDLTGILRVDDRGARKYS